jgi:UDP-N-acetylglucosamine acyltransferase
MTKIHATAIIEKGAELGNNVEVGAYSVIDKNVKIGDGTIISPHVHITGYTTIGKDCAIYTGAVIGQPAQDKRYVSGMVSYLEIGDRNIIRECVTMNLAVGDGEKTIIGNENMFMAYSHIGHNCRVGNNVCLANAVGVSGGCQIDDRAVIGGITGLHQNVRIGRLAMVGGLGRISYDVPPFVIHHDDVYGVNAVGLRRADISADTRLLVKRMIRAVFSNTNNLCDTIVELRETMPQIPEVNEFLDFVSKSGRKGRQLEKIVF